jgi:phosphoserine phosphatase
LKGAFRSIVLDVDSTLCGIEGIDWLADRRGPSVAAVVTSLTDRAMRGEIALENVYARRLEMVRPDTADIGDLSRAYIAALAPDAEAAIHNWLRSGKRVVLVSGGIRSALLPLALRLAIPESDVHAVKIHHANSGEYAGYDTSSPLSVATGKRDVIAGLNLEPPILAVGDGSTDLLMRETANCFVAFTGFATRQPVIERADAVVDSFEELARLVEHGSH